MTYPSGGREPGTEGEFHDELLREQAQGDAAAANPEDRTAAHWLRAIDQLDEDIRVSTRRSRAARKASGWFVLGASVFSAVALAVQMVSDWLDLPASVMDVLFGALGVGLVLSAGADPVDPAPRSQCPERAARRMAAHRARIPRGRDHGGALPTLVGPDGGESKSAMGLRGQGGTGGPARPGVER